MMTVADRPELAERPPRGTFRTRRSTRGFTLIEVVIAVGIVATVFVALMGMVPIGLSTMKDATTITMQAQIGQKLIGELQLADWRKDGGSGNSVILAYDGEERYYDEFGNSLDGSGEDVLYTALIEVRNDPVTLPGQKGNKFMRYVSVKVAYTPPGMEVDFSDDAEDPRYARYSAIVADLKVRGEDLK